MDSAQGLTGLNIFLVVTSYLLAAYVNRVTRSRSLPLLAAILTAHHLVAYLFAFHLPFPPNEVDPAMFLGLAEECNKYNYCGYLGAHLYAHYIAWIFSIGGSLYSVFLVNILFFVISIVFFTGVARLLSLDGNRKIMLLFYGLWPSVMFFSTMNYRETFELYLLVTGTYFGLRGGRDNNYLHMFLGMLCLLLMGIFHVKGLLYLSLGIFTVVCLYQWKYDLRSAVARLGLLLVMTAGVFAAQHNYVADLKKAANSEQIVVAATNNEADGKHADREASKKPPVPDRGLVENFLGKVESYRNRLLEQRAVRTAFISRINTENFGVFLATYSLVYLEYLFAPMIVQVSIFHDLLAYGESLVRLILFISSLFLIRRMPQARYLLAIYLLVTSMWAIGVISYGAAIRHHVMTNWILIILGIPLIADYVGRNFSNKS